MKYTAELKVYKDPKKIFNVFLPELKQLKGARADFGMKKEKDHINFNINAKDPVAFKAILNSITNLLIIYEKMEKQNGS